MELRVAVQSHVAAGFSPASLRPTRGRRNMLWPPPRIDARGQRLLDGLGCDFFDLVVFHFAFSCEVI